LPRSRPTNCGHGSSPACSAARSFAECIDLAANHDGDSDSTALIAGQLYGARHGLAALPAEAAYRLDVIGPLLTTFGKPISL
jgi:ADP-ribosylglycohydrolase